MVKKLMLAVAAVALLAVPAFAAVQNVKVSGDLKTTSVVRSDFDLGASAVNGGVEAGTSQNVILSQVGLNVQADLTDNVSAMIRLGNERLWGTADNTGTVDQVNMDTAYVSMKEFLYAPLTMTIGRQPLQYGNQFLIGDSGAYNEVLGVNDLTGGVNFDAVKAVLSYDPLTIDLFMAKVSEGTITGEDDDDDANLYGINANYKFGDKMGTILEGYTFVVTDKTALDPTTLNMTKADVIYSPGLRVSVNPIEGINLQLEGTYQFGTLGQAGTAEGKTKLSAYGLQGKMNYALPVMKDQSPVLSAGITYLSGGRDKDADNKDHYFVSLFRNQYVGRIFNALGANSSNLFIGELAFEMVPVKDVTAKLTWYNLALVNKFDATPPGNTNTVTLPNGCATTYLVTGNKAIGNELDLDLTYAYTEDVKFGVTAGYFAPGKAFSSDNKDSATQLLSSVSVAF